MKSMKKVLLGLMIAGCAVANASADPIEYTGFFLADADLSGAGTTQRWTFGTTADDVAGAVQGDTFVYTFLFNTPPPSSMFSFLANPDVGGSLAFTSASLVSDLDGSPVGNFFMSVGGSQVSGTAHVDSGNYDLILAGNFLADGATFSGAASADLADPLGPNLVPEPMSLSLMGLGLVGMAGLRRRKAAKAA